MTRIDGRENNEMRPITMDTDYLKHPEGSVLITVGDTKVICTASIEDRVPPFMRNSGKGWIAAEYSMLPRATEQRNIREAAKGKLSGRTMEIQRLIGRSLRSVVDLTKIGERTIWIDCDVIQADGGTRTASITGAFVAMTMAIKEFIDLKKIKSWPVTDFLAAVSVGVDPEQTELLDLCYKEDASAAVDMNIVMTGTGEFVELQGTGEEASYSREQLNHMLDLGEKGMQELFNLQRELLGSTADHITNLKEAE
ncbi:ribonuclease PH [Salibacterium salarium]|uniref:Ribonuclease PH n=1 Tax=Salibacterium salarium TaxID=284579 RepID=A0A428N1E7_9BACI|nr:ribonuclease PH [Salibacterium salarium]MDQ0298643.1 ribonuclease PH [Salibacterium salarium]RSL32233.1 ribonuclease PH [Salibacterium salarium]